MGTFVDFEQYCAQLLQLLHISKTACLITGQNNSSLATCKFDSGPEYNRMDFVQHLSLHGLWYLSLLSTITCALVNKAIVNC